ncbi:MAG TPA: alpha/beta hydrolase, partial [Opitutaceae bacterium]|nr:alpha/beta hydrolase [Opitutaceae bacterium]
RTLVFSEDHGQKLSMDFYPASSGKSAPCVIAIHGGGWDGGDRTQLPGINELLALRGYAVATIDYRLAPAAVWPAQREDTLAALRYLQAHALELNIDGQRFVLLGRSAGGQIAVTTAYEAHEPAICGVVSLYGPHDMLFAWQCGKENDVLNSMLLLKQYLGGTPQTAPSNFESASSYFQVDKSVPPTLLMHGEIDTLVWNKQSERLASRLAENGVPHHFMSLPWGVHAFDFNLNGPSGQLTTYTLEYFLSAVTK